MILIGCLFASWVVVAVSGGAGCEDSPSAVLSAVVPLRSGADCATLSLRGAQQLAALHQAVADVNADLKAQDGLSIGLRWEDSCGSDAGAVSASLRLLVDAQQTCPQPPFHIGMVGPEGASQLTRVLAVTGVFNVTHILPRTTHAVDAHHAVVAVTVDRITEQAQSVATAARRLGWHSFGLTFEESLSDLADAIVKMGNDAAICVKGAVKPIAPAPASASVALPTGADGTVVLAESADTASRILASVPASPLLLVVRQVGLEAWQLPPQPRNVFLLQQISTINAKVQEAMNATLKSQLAAQRQARCNGRHECTGLQDILSEVTDESVTALSDGVRLLAAAFRATRHTCNGHVNCGQVSAAEWRNIVRRVTATRHAPDSTRLRFNMDLPSSYALYARNDAGTLVQVASVSAGVLKQTLASYTFPPAPLGAGQCEGSQGVVLAPPPPSLPIDSAAPHSPTLKDLYTTEYAFYELVGMICGVGFIMFAIMVIIIYVIYNSLVEKGDKESTGGSVESRGGSVAAAATRGRAPRRNLRDTFRRGSSVRSSTHS